MFGYSWWTLNPAAMCSYRNFGNYQLYNNLHIMSVDTDNCSSILCVQPCNLDTSFFSILVIQFLKAPVNFCSNLIALRKLREGSTIMLRLTDRNKVVCCSKHHMYRVSLFEILVYISL